MNTTSYRAGAAAAVAAGATWVVSAVLQVTAGNGTGEKVEGFSGHAIIGLFTVALLLMGPAMFALSRHALSDLGARIATPGLVILGLTCIVSNVRGEDPSFFVVVAPLTNLLWLAGSVWPSPCRSCRSLRCRCRRSAARLSPAPTGSPWAT